MHGIWRAISIPCARNDSFTPQCMVPLAFSRMQHLMNRAPDLCGMAGFVQPRLPTFLEECLAVLSQCIPGEKNYPVRQVGMLLEEDGVERWSVQGWHQH